MYRQTGVIHGYASSRWRVERKKTRRGRRTGLWSVRDVRVFGFETPPHILKVTSHWRWRSLRRPHARAQASPCIRYSINVFVSRAMGHVAITIVPVNHCAARCHDTSIPSWLPPGIQQSVTTVRARRGTRVMASASTFHRQIRLQPISHDRFFFRIRTSACLALC